jgi:hypothetical protein
MTTSRASSRYGFWQSIICKNIVLFVAILLVAIVPLAWRYYRDCRNEALQHLATTLEVFAERGAGYREQRHCGEDRDRGQDGLSGIVWTLGAVSGRDARVGVTTMVNGERCRGQVDVGTDIASSDR